MNLKSIIPEFIKDYRHKQRIDKLQKASYLNWRKENYYKWEKEGKPIPPPHSVKQKVIHDYITKYGCEIFVETGTLHGDMIEAQKLFFNQLYSIELDKKLFKDAVNRFRYDRKIQIINGDSGKVMYELIKKINKRAIFWLDGHYSGTYTALGDLECPIYEELKAIFTSKIKNHIIIIDDARCFTGNNSYPSVLELKDFVLKYNSNYKMIIDTDSIRFEY
jgi:hypothetical protein